MQPLLPKRTFPDGSASDAIAGHFELRHIAPDSYQSRIQCFEPAVWYELESHNLVTISKIGNFMRRKTHAFRHL